MVTRYKPVFPHFSAGIGTIYNAKGGELFESCRVTFPKLRTYIYSIREMVLVPDWTAGIQCNRIS
jgi:hypothetical protein